MKRHRPHCARRHAKQCRHMGTKTISHMSMETMSHMNMSTHEKENHTLGPAHFKLDAEIASKGGTDESALRKETTPWPEGPATCEYTYYTISIGSRCGC